MNTAYISCINDTIIISHSLLARDSLHSNEIIQTYSVSESKYFQWLPSWMAVGVAGRPEERTDGRNGRTEPVETSANQRTMARSPNIATVLQAQVQLELSSLRDMTRLFGTLATPDRSHELAVEIIFRQRRCWWASRTETDLLRCVIFNVISNGWDWLRLVNSLAVFIRHYREMLMSIASKGRFGWWYRYVRFIL